MNKNEKLFIVEFGKPDMGGWVSFGGNQRPVYVIANSYDEAAKKAMIYAESNIEGQSVMDSDGNLNLNNEELRIKAVKLACEEVVW